MKNTPLQKAIAEITDGEYLPAAELRWVTKILQSLLPYERECIEGAYNSGYYKGADREEFKDEQYFTNTFKTNPQGGGVL